MLIYIQSAGNQRLQDHKINPKQATAPARQQNLASNPQILLQSDNLKYIVEFNYCHIIYVVTT